MPVNMKAMIAETFLTLAGQKNVDKITVKDLVEACGISRQTFYYHFQDIIDVVEWLVERNTQTMLERSLAAGDPREAIRIFVADAVEKRDLIQRLLASQRLEQVRGTMFQAFRTYLRELFRSREPAQPVRVSDLETLIDFCAFGIAGLLLEHCQRPRTDVELLTDQIYRLLSGEMIPRVEP